MSTPLKMIRPLIHIGSAKSASTWLQAQLFRNAFLGFEEMASRTQQKSFLTDPSESEFDSEAASEFFAPIMNDILERELCPVVSLERLSGISRKGDINKLEFADRLHAVFPEGHILYIVREQASMWSAQYLQYIRRGGHRSIQWFLDQDTSTNCSATYFSWKRFEYDQLVNYYQQKFGKDRILVLPLEMLVASPSAFLSRILSFCNLSPSAAHELQFAPPERQSSSSLSYSFMRRMNLFFTEPTGFDPAPVWSNKGAKTRLRAVAKAIDSMLPAPFRQCHRKRLDQAIKQRLGDYYAASNSALESQSGIDLGAFGYSVEASA